MIREKIIQKYVENKEVLDIGSVGQSQKYGLWNLLKKHTKSLVGIDTEKPKDKQIVQGNMETYSFKKTFDVIVAGDVLEHVVNQGLFLKNIRKHLKKNGKLIITTPNAKWFTIILRPNPTHTTWHDKHTLTRVLQINGFKVEKFSYYYGNKQHYSFLKRLLTKRQAMLVVCSKN
tara:strand:- start:7903 stop:8424 length:522 start_codon:yes stop_codon:yes gene_type:complete